MTDDCRAQAVVCDSLAGLRAMRGEFDTARELLARSNAILAELGRGMQSAVSHPEAFVALNCGDARRRRGDAARRIRAPAGDGRAGAAFVHRGDARPRAL